MKLGTTFAALALVGAAVSTSNIALSQSQEPPHTLTAPKSGLMTNNSKVRKMSFAEKAGPRANEMPAAPKAADPKNK